MDIAFLTDSQALGPGADIWIVANEKMSSLWTGRLDWLLNFQLEKWNRHETSDLAPELKHILQEEELEFPQVQVNRTSGVLIASSNLLPNTYTFFAHPEAQWWIRALEYFHEVPNTTCRIFCSNSIKPEEMESSLKKVKNMSRPIQIVRSQ